MIGGWIVSLLRRNVTVVDTLWGIGFVLIAWLTLYQVGEATGRRWLLAGLTTVWGVRLTAHLTWRNRGKGEDPRYGKWRRAAGGRFWWTSLFKVFLLQALFLWVIALSLQAGLIHSGPPGLGWLDLAGGLVWLTGFGFEAVGDWQLARFKSDPAHRGRVMDRGLWRYTRHPNYFGECLIWWGLFIIALSHPWNAWTVISPVTLTLVLLKMTGIPLTEASITETRPAYRAYQERTPAFIPGRPKPRRSPTER
jgi:steroid 5-alpha reductase family enzyme